MSVENGTLVLQDRTQDVRAGVAGDWGPSWYATLFKQPLDVAISLTLLALLWPLILVLMGLVRWTSPGPALYRQKRLGLNGKPFTILKLRTMRVDAESLTGPVWSSGEDDPRVTPLGRFLRRTHLDELPQLWNVVRGDMSLVGPRPERPPIARVLERVIPEYPERTRIRPGVTGLAQVQWEADWNVGGTRRKVAYDLHYAEAMGPWLDLRIIAATALKVVGCDFDRLGRLLSLPTREVVFAHLTPDGYGSEHDAKTLAEFSRHDTVT